MESIYLGNANVNKSNSYNMNGNNYNAIDNEKSTMLFDDNYMFYANSFQLRINKWGVMLGLYFKFDWQFKVTLVM